MAKEILCCAMMCEDMNTAILAPDAHQVDFYDVVLRDEDGQPLEEIEDIPTFEEAEKAVNQLLKKCPDADVEYIGG